MGDMAVSIDRLHSYPKVWNMGHRAIAELFAGDVVVQEKVDGSQFTFGVIGGELQCRSKGAMIYLPCTDKLFQKATETAQTLHDEGNLVGGWQYRCEAVRAPKHNTLEYERAPDAGMVLFDVDTGIEDRVSSPDELVGIAKALGLEVVPTLYTGLVGDLDQLMGLLDAPPMLGGEMIEGVVVKNYARWGEDGKMLMGKLVAEKFREDHKKSWTKTNPGKGDVIQRLKDTYRTERRWEKAVERMRDAGTLDGSPRDIGPLLKSVQQDIEDECADEIAQTLARAFLPDIKRGSTAGLAEWYKARLLDGQTFGAE